MKPPIIFIGRFQPLHNAHLAVIEEAAEKTDNLVIVLGSSSYERSFKNPWLPGERADMIYRSVSKYTIQKLSVIFAVDHPANDNIWANSVKDAVNHTLHLRTKFTMPVKYLTGYRKDASSFYLDLFPEWKFKPTSVSSPLNASDIRLDYFLGLDGLWDDTVPQAVRRYLYSFRQFYHEDFSLLQQEYKKWATQTLS